ncbi:class I SAM-dependent methyltransferase family protein [Alkalinema pantanalense CENA528]|uniref:class I SAM-dependent methyltransferase family protein n=1 Tax=Alkalinema pantanalense TaxID=1620705 RepID=UPI003D6FED5B
MPKNWFEWHNLYQSETRLQQRLEIVQEYLTRAIDAQPAGTIQVVSACAGDGRDLIGTLSNHPRKKDVRARLVELNPQLVEQGKASLVAARLTEQIEFINGDATLSDNYAGAVPADIVIFCGIFGNLADEAALQRLIGNLKFLAKPGAFVPWTRGNRDGDYAEVVRRNLQAANFEEVDFRFTETGDQAVGLHRYQGETAPLPANEHLFVFSGSPDRAVEP